MSRGAYSAWAPGDMIYNIRWKNFNFTATRLTQLDEHWTPGGGGGERTPLAQPSLGQNSGSLNN